MLFMSRNGKAPHFLGRTNRQGVPWVALLFSNLRACIAFLAVSSSAGRVYSALITLSGGEFNSNAITNPTALTQQVATFIVWATIEFVHIRFRKALRAQGQSLDTLPFKAKWHPYGTYAALAVNVFLVFFQGYTAFLNPFSTTDFVQNYILLPVFVIFVVVYKFWKKTKWVKLEEMDIWSGRREYADEEIVASR